MLQARTRALRSALRGLRAFSTDETAKPVTVLFLGPPGVGKGTYSSRVADYFGLTSFTTGELVRDAMLAGSELGHEFDEGAASGRLMPDAPILRLVRSHFMSAHSEGVDRFVLDGFPRTVVQAQALDQFADVQLAVNLGLRQEVLVTKILGRRRCRYCRKTFNVKEIHLPATDDGLPAVNVPAILPPEQCLAHLEQHSELGEAQVRAALEEHERAAAPVLRYYKERMKLVDFEVVGGVEETLPRLLGLLRPALEVPPLQPLRAEQQQREEEAAAEAGA